MIRDPLGGDPSPRNVALGPTESTVFPPGQLADCDFPGQVTRGASCRLRTGCTGAPGLARGSPRGPGTGRSVRPPRSTCWVPAGRLAQAAGRGEDSGRHSRPGVVGGTHRVAQLRQGALKVGDAESSGGPGVATTQPTPAARVSIQTSGLFEGHPSSLPEKPRSFSCAERGETWRSHHPLAPGARISDTPTHTHTPPMPLTSDLQTLGAYF